MKSMGMKHKFWIIFLFLLLSLSFAFSQKNKEDFSVFQDLVSVVSEIDTLIEVPPSLADIVSSYYVEKVVADNEPNDVLTYLTNIYSEHGYDEYGSWVVTSDYSIRNSTIKNGSSGYYKQSKFSSYNLPSDFKFPKYNISDIKMPINGSYTSFYGYRPKFGRFHKGVDISLKTGDTVRSVLPGVVVKIKCDPKGYGNYVVVSHDGDLETLYAHLTKELVVSGQRLKAGEALGIGGATGNATGPHLHFETRIKGEAIDPLVYLPKKGVRK